MAAKYSSKSSSSDTTRSSTVGLLTQQSQGTPPRYDAEGGLEEELSHSLRLSSIRSISTDIERNKGDCARCGTSSSVRMPCGHDMCPTCLSTYSHSEVFGSRRTVIECINTECRAEWTLKTLKLYGGCHSSEIKELSDQLSKNFMLYLWECPGCGTRGERQDGSAVRVQCPSCSSLKKKNSWYCFHCRKPWKGLPTKSTCGNSGCNGQDMNLAKSLKISKSEIGRGSYGVVFNGTLRGDSVAVKRIHSCMSDKKAAYEIKKLEEEGRMLKSLSHPNLVQCFGFVEKDGDFYIVMEKMDLNLRTWLQQIKGKSFGPGVPVDISRQIADGLNYLHTHKSSPVIHRDLSSKNILLKIANMASVKITDFGTAKYHPKELMYHHTEQPGALHYMPPEALGKHTKYTEKLDVFSLGVLMIEIETCSFNPIGMLGIGSEPEYSRRKNQLDKVKSEELKEIILQCIENDYNDRPSAGKVVSDLSALLVNLSISLPADQQ